MACMRCSARFVKSHRGKGGVIARQFDTRLQFQPIQARRGCPLDRVIYQAARQALAPR